MIIARNRRTRLRMMLAVCLAFGATAPLAPARDAAAQPGPGGEFAPTWDDDEDDDDSVDEGPSGTFAPSWDDDEDDSVDAGPSGTFAPSWDDDEDDSGDAGPSGTFAPSWDDDEDDSVDEGPSGTFAPSWDDDEDDDGMGGDFAPSWDDEDDEDDEEGMGSDFAPSWDDDEDDDWRSNLPEDDDEEYYMRMWETLDRAADADEFVEPEGDELPEGLGRIAGVVLDDEFNAPLGDVTVAIDETNQRAVTGPSGVFHFDLEPGVYTVRFRGLGYQTRAFQIEVFDGEVAEFGNVRMGEDSATAMTIEVQGRMDRNTGAAQLVQRRQAGTTRDAISAETISRSGDSSASEAARRVVSVTVVDGRYAVIRGLSGRYNQVLINGIPAPILNPYYQAVELDMFPSSVLAGMAIYKVPSADLLGDFAGGLLEIETSDFSEDFDLRLSFGLSGDTMTTFQQVQRYDGGRLDWLGFDDGTRRLPDAFDLGPLEINALRDRYGLTRGEAQDLINQIARTLDNNWDYNGTTALPRLSLGGTVSDTVEFEGDRALSYRLTFNYREGFRRRTGFVGETEFADFEPILGDRELNTFSVNWGILGSARYDFDANNELTFVTLFNNTGEDRVGTRIGFVPSYSAVQDRYELTFVNRRTLFTQLVGAHRDLPGNSDLTWSFAVAQGRSYRPDQRFMAYIQRGDEFRFGQDPGSGERFFEDLGQVEYTGRFDWAFQLGDEFRRRQIGLGAIARYSDRDFRSRRFRYTLSGATDEQAQLPPEQLLAPENVGDFVRLREFTTPTDNYDLTSLLVGGYLRADIEVNDWLRLVAGSRLELFEQEITAEGIPEGTGQRTDVDLLPSASAIFSLRDDMQIRLAYGASVARPQGHEFAPTIVQDYWRRRQIQGNPELERTRVQNFDLRWELFPSPAEVISVTAFYKRFSNHIEDVIVSTGGSTQAQNLAEARNFGAELEVQLDLGRYWSQVRGLGVAANLALIYSRAVLSTEEAALFASTERPMTGQSPVLANFILSYDHERSGWTTNLVYGIIGRRLDRPATAGFADEYTATYHRLDVNASWDFAPNWSLKLNLDNLLMQPWQTIAGDFVIEQVDGPIEFGVGVSWRY